MSIVNVKARISCDGCGRHFLVDLDPARMRPKGWSLADEAEDVVRGGTWEVMRGTPRVEGQCSVQGDHSLCGSCTRIVDEHTPENPTRRQVRRAIDRYVKPLRLLRSQQ